MPIQGAEALHNGKASDLAGFHEESDHDFSITLSQPYAAFLACLSTPGASVLDEESTVEAGDRFGRDPEYTIGTGPFIFRRWNRGVDMVLEANRECWSGAPRSEGLLIQAGGRSELR